MPLPIIARSREVTAARVRELLHYDAATGTFAWRKSKGRAKAGSIAGTPRNDGYSQIGIDGVMHLSHRLAVLHVTGELPAETVDHRNRQRSENRFENLRAASFTENACNKPAAPSSSTGVKGVSPHSCTGKLQVRIKHQGQAHFLGLFDSMDAAAAAYATAAVRLHGDFARVA